MSTLAQLKLIKEDKEQIIHLTVPLLIKLLEWAREDAKSDIAIHILTDKITTKNKILSSKDYMNLM